MEGQGMRGEWDSPRGLLRWPQMQGEMRNLGLREGKLVTQDHTTDCARTASSGPWTSSLVSLCLLPQAWGSVLAQCGGRGRGGGVSRLSGRGVEWALDGESRDVSFTLSSWDVESERRSISAAGIDRRTQLSYLQNGNKKLGDTCLQRPNVGLSLGWDLYSELSMPMVGELLQWLQLWGIRYTWFQSPSGRCTALTSLSLSSLLCKMDLIISWIKWDNPGKEPSPAFDINVHSVLILGLAGEGRATMSRMEVKTLRNIVRIKAWVTWSFCWVARGSWESRF